MIDIDFRLRLGSTLIAPKILSAEIGVTALFGRSGAGKTSILNAVAGLVRPESGKIIVGGETFFDSERRINVPAQKRRLGVVFQEGRLFPHMSVRKNLTYGAPRPSHTSPTPQLNFDDLVDLLGISALLDRAPATLSGGERQRVAIGRALLMRPKALLMDEPLASLDGPRKAELLPMLAELRRVERVPILYVSHQMDEIVRLADTMVLVDQGHVIASGSVEELTSRFDLRPLTGRHEAGSVLSGTVRLIDKQWGLAEVALNGSQKLIVPARDLPLGERVRVRLRARDVALAQTRPVMSSFQNMFDATIDQLAEADGPHVDVRLQLKDGLYLWARVTAKSAAALNLQAGMPIVALIKTVAIDRHSIGPPPSSP